MNIKRLPNLPHSLLKGNAEYWPLETCGQDREDLADSVIVTPHQKQKKAAGMKVKLR